MVPAGKKSPTRPQNLAVCTRWDIQLLLATRLSMQVIDMAIYCGKCGKEVDTLSKRRHRCRKNPLGKKQEESTHIQLIFWSMRAQREFDHVGNGK